MDLSVLANEAFADGRDHPECRLPPKMEYPNLARWVENASHLEAQAVAIYYWDTYGLARLSEAYNLSRFDYYKSH